jgi:hypothetical protein
VSPQLKAPFPYFGGKSRAAEVCWRAFGANVPGYIEPFCGSLAMLLGRPNGPGKIETVNDKACAIANFWRAMAADPAAVARWCDRPVNECDMHAIHIWLVRRLAEIEPELRSDPEFFDAKVAGWWVYGACCWIGGGWCGGVKRGLPRPNLNGGQGINAPTAYSPGRRPALSSAGAGINVPTIRQKPHLSSDNGVHRLPSVGNDRAIFGVSAPPTLDWFLALQARIRRVRVCCGDWTRVLGDSVLGKGKNVGGRRPCAVFLDPPYSHEFRDAYLYSEDDATISAKVREWALEHGDDPELRIALCGYSGEHEMPSTWTEHAWKAARGYSKEGNNNRELERIWFSPHCLPIEQQRSLFA